MTSRSRKHTAELLNDLADRTRTLLLGYNIPLDVADQIGFALADDIAVAWGGQPIYIPLDMRFRLSERDHKIFNDLEELGPNGLARKYGLSVQRIYKIIKRIRHENATRDNQNTECSK